MTEAQSVGAEQRYCVSQEASCGCNPFRDH